MASGSFSNGSGQNCKLVINWSSSKGNSGSTVNATLIAQNQNNWYFSAYVYGGYGITINGDEVTGSDKALSGSINGSVNLISHSVWVAYTGDKTINIQGYANFNGIPNLSNQTISGNVQLDNVGYVPTMGSVTSPTTSIVPETTTSITVKWNKASSYDGACIYSVGCSINGGAYEWKYPKSDINTTSYTWQIGTPTQGATYQFAVSAKNNIGWSSYEYSGKVTINKINPPTIGDIDTYNPYVNSTLTINLSGGSQSDNGNLVRLCDLYYGSTWLASSKSYDNTSWWNKVQTISYAAANYASNIGSKAYVSDNFKIVAWCENSRRSRSSYVTKYFTVNLNSDGGATPVLGAPTISGGELGYPSTCFAAKVSTVNVTSATAQLRRAPAGTTVSYQISCTGVNAQNAGTAKFSNLSAGLKDITVTAIDSRGLTTSVSTKIQVQPYASPTIHNLTAERLKNPQTSVKLSYTLAYSEIYAYDKDVNTKGSSLNTINYQQYSLDDSKWINAKNEMIITGLSTESVFYVYLSIADKLRPSTYINDSCKIQTIKTNMALRRHGVGINCVPQSDFALEVSGNSKISNDFQASDQLYSTSQGVAIGKSVEKDGFEVNVNSVFNNTVTVDGTINANADVAIGGSLIALNGMTQNCGRPESINTFYGDASLRYFLATSNCKTGKPPTDSGVLNLAWDNNKYDMQLAVNKNRIYTRAGSDGQGTWSPWKTYLPVDVMFPVGAVYITYNNNNPGNFLGGTWVQFGQGRTLMGQGTGNDGSTSMTFTTAGDTGGKYKTSHSHTTSFGWDSNAFFAGRPDGAANNNYSRTSVVANGYVIQATSSTTSASRLNWTEEIAVNHIQPYVTIYFWRRTA